jgi:EmrB/QacA subfamily drug resistance transporter
MPTVLRWRALAAISLGVLVTTIDASIVNIALPAIGRDFQASLSAVSWVNLAYLMGVTATLLSVGRLSDLFGRRRVYVTGFGLFSVMALLCGFAPNLSILIALRAVQAIGASMMLANALAIVSLCFPASERGRVFGMAAAFASAGVGIGPLLGGSLVTALSWRWVFWFYAPIAIIGTLFAWRVVPEDEARASGETLDIKGALLTLTGMTCLVLSLKFLPGEAGWIGVILGVAALAAGIMLYRHGRKTHFPLVSPAFITHPILRAAILDAFLGYLALYIYVLLLPFFLIDYLGQPAALAGLVLTAEPAVSIFTGPIGGRLSDRFGSRVLVLIGLGITALALWALSGLTAQSDLWAAIWRVALIGLGFGLFYTPNKSALIGSAPTGHLGVATGMAEVAANLGMAAGIALGSALVSNPASAMMASGPVFADDFSLAMRVASIICVVALVICALWMASPRQLGLLYPDRPRDQGE